MGGVPTLICGDLNQDVASLDCAVNLALGGWADLGRAPTCVARGAKRARRIDVMLANRALAARAGEAGLSWVTGLCTHAYQWTEVDFGRRDRVPTWVKGRGARVPKEGKERAEHEFHKCVDELGGFRRACSMKDVEGAWGALQGLAEKVAGRCGGDGAEKGKVVWRDEFPKAMGGRWWPRGRSRM